MFEEIFGTLVMAMGRSIAIDIKIAIELAARGLNVLRSTLCKLRLEVFIKEIEAQHIAGKYRQTQRLKSFSLGRYLSAALKLNLIQVK